MTTLARTLSQATAMLGECSESPRADALLLLERAVGRPREWILAFGELPLAEPLAANFLQACAARRSGMPVAYVLGSAGFYGREFAVNANVLIPRPETEHLVDEAIAFFAARDKLQRDLPGAMLDLGCGSGAIGCTIAAETRAHVCGTDISLVALETARENARRLNASQRCTFLEGDLLDPVRSRRFDCVVANLPYVPTADLPEPPTPGSFEPRQALDGGPDGLRLYRRLLPDLKTILNPNALVLLEAAPPTIDALHDLVCSTFPDFAISVCPDYAGLARYIKAQA